MLQADSQKLNMERGFRHLAGFEESGNEDQIVRGFGRGSKAIERSGGLQSSPLCGRSEDFIICLSDHSLAQTGKPLRRLKNHSKRNYSGVGVSVGRNTVRRLIASQDAPAVPDGSIVKWCTFRPPKRRLPAPLRCLWQGCVKN